MIQAKSNTNNLGLCFCSPPFLWTKARLLLTTTKTASNLVPSSFTSLSPLISWVLGNNQCRLVENSRLSKAYLELGIQCLCQGMRGFQEVQSRYCTVSPAVQLCCRDWLSTRLLPSQVLLVVSSRAEPWGGRPDHFWRSWLLPQQWSGTGTIFSEDKMKTHGLVTEPSIWRQGHLENLPRWKGAATIALRRSCSLYYCCPIKIWVTNMKHTCNFKLFYSIKELKKMYNSF